MEQQVEAEELSNSILIEISKSSVSRWHEKLQNRYGWFKSENCKNIIFEVSIVYEYIIYHLCNKFKIEV